MNVDVVGKVRQIMKLTQKCFGRMVSFNRTLKCLGLFCILGSTLSVQIWAHEEVIKPTADQLKERFKVEKEYHEKRKARLNKSMLSEENASTPDDIYTKLFKKYKNSGATSFDNFHEQFLVLQALNFPNIENPNNQLSLEGKDYKDPQKLILYRQAQKDAHGEWLKDPATSARARQNQIDRYDSAKQDVLKQENQQSKTRALAVRKFTKDSYYNYFTSILNGYPSTEKVQVFVALNDDLISDSATKSYAQIKEEFDNNVDYVLASLNGQDYEIRSKDRKYSSYVEFYVNQVALDILYRHTMVGVITHPQTVTDNPNNIKGR